MKTSENINKSAKSCLLIIRKAQNAIGNCCLLAAALDSPETKPDLMGLSDKVLALSQVSWVGSEQAWVRGRDAPVHACPPAAHGSAVQAEWRQGCSGMQCSRLVQQAVTFAGKPQSSWWNLPPQVRLLKAADTLSTLSWCKAGPHLPASLSQYVLPPVLPLSPIHKK